MLNCELCDYYKTTSVYKESEKMEIPSCELTGYVFRKNPDNLDIEYPCFDFEFDKYLTIPEKPKSPINVDSIDWKFKYNRRHIKPSTDKERICG